MQTLDMLLKFGFPVCLFIHHTLVSVERAKPIITHAHKEHVEAAPFQFPHPT